MDKRRLEIICGDAIEKMKDIPDESIDLIVTDPPYNLNKKKMVLYIFLWGCVIFPIFMKS